MRQAFLGEGEIIPVNPNHGEIAGLKSYPSLADVPASIDVVLVSILQPVWDAGSSGS